jgi:hypothetical protein
MFMNMSYWIHGMENLYMKVVEETKTHVLFLKKKSPPPLWDKEATADVT